MFVVRRTEGNPLLRPNPDHPWEAVAAFNWCPVRNEKEIHVLYRAMARPELLENNHVALSTIGHALSADGGVTYQGLHPLIVPEHEWERYGCEDPRVTKIDGTYYIFYTALSTFPFSAPGIRVGVAISDNLRTVREKHLVTPFNAKAMALFPEKVCGKYTAILTVNTDNPPSYIAVAQSERLEDFWNESFWQSWLSQKDENVLSPNPYRVGDDWLEVGAPPIRTDLGWLLIYSHIQHYGGGKTVFGIEALLLDLDNPRQILGRTKGPILVPETPYERFGTVQNIVFPTGALVDRDTLTIFYGAADTTGCTATVSLSNLLASMVPATRAKLVRRYDENPLITPNPNNAWEAKATFNPGAIDLGGKVHLLYRAMSHDNTSVMGYAASDDGLRITKRLAEPAYTPRASFEQKRQSGNSGCEDPRLIAIDGRVYMFYTAFDGVEAPRVAVSSIPTDAFVANDWTAWNEPQVITPPGVMDKDTALLPEKVGDHYLLFHRISDVICVDMFETLDFTKEKVRKCVQIITPRPGMWDSGKVGIATPPIKTEWGWVLFYHGVSEHTRYRLGAVLLDLNDPTIVLSRTTAPLLEPELEYERVGQVPDVVFPSGAVLRDGTFYIYYGGADTVVAVALISLADLIRIFDHHA